jgi:hypothetical protein
LLIELVEDLDDDKEDGERNDDAKTDFQFEVSQLHLSSEIDTLLEELIRLSTHRVSLLVLLRCEVTLDNSDFTFWSSDPSRDQTSAWLQYSYNTAREVGSYMLLAIKTGFSQQGASTRYPGAWDSESAVECCRRLPAHRLPVGRLNRLPVICQSTCRVDGDLVRHGDSFREEHERIAGKQMCNMQGYLVVNPALSFSQQEGKILFLEGNGDVIEHRSV